MTPFLLQLSGVFASADDERTLVRNLARAVVPAFAEWCTVHLLRSGATIENVVAIGADDAELSRGFANLAADAPLRAALDEARVYDANDVAIDAADAEFLRGVAARSAIVAPIVVRGAVIGAIRFLACGRQFGDDDVLVARDVAARAALAIDNVRSRSEAVASEKSRDLFLAMLSHEMKTPLTSILGWARLLRTDGAGSELFDEGLSAIEQSAKVQQRLIDDLLDVSRVITGKLHLDFRVVGVRALLHDAAEMFAPRAKENGQHIRVTAPDGPSVYGDETRLRQVLWNLLSNAVKYTPGGGLIELAAQAEEERVVIRVRDTGRGIREEVLPHVFDRFHQATVADRAQHGGLGLGLAIVRNIVELHGGRVDASSDGEGKGATFSVHLPLHRRPNDIEGETR
jgi:signal transduction histidine kinase